jgi:peroxiredoxin
MKKFGLLLLILVGFFSCKQGDTGKFQVSGKYRNADKIFTAGQGAKLSGKVLLVEIPFGKDQNIQALDSAPVTGANASFELNAKGKKDGVYELVFGDNIMAIPLIDDENTVSLDIDLGKQEDFFEVSGSPATNGMKEFIANFSKKKGALDKITENMDSLRKTNAPDSVLALVAAEKSDALAAVNKYSLDFLKTANDPTLIGFILNWASLGFTQQQFEQNLYNYQKKYPDNEVLADMKKKYDLQKALAQQETQQQQSMASSWIGKQAPELDLPDVTGKTVPLASFKGKYLLVDFWASWCGPCRAENPNVVKAYGEFKNKNFAILGVSLDKDKQSWQQAVKEDRLEWAQVSDLKEWNSKAVGIYQFQGIPFNVLIDPDGKVISQELRGPALEDKLKQVLQ